MGDLPRRPYVTLWANPTSSSALANTAIVAVIAVVIAIVLAVLFALYTEREGAVGGAAGARHLLPFLLPPIVTGLSLLVASAELGIARAVTIVIGHTVFVLAVAYRLVLTRLEALPARWSKPPRISAPPACRPSAMSCRRILLPRSSPAQCWR